METSQFEIEILEQGWLGSEDTEYDLCSHGKLRLVIGGQVISSGEERYGISESALALLRTLASNHGREHPVAERLVFHGCGTLLMMGCPIGIDWVVTHTPEGVRLDNIIRFDTTNEKQARFTLSKKLLYNFPTCASCASPHRWHGSPKKTINRHMRADCWHESCANCKGVFTANWAFLNRAEKHGIKFDGLVTQLTEEEYRRQVIEFALKARQLFQESLVLTTMTLTESNSKLFGPNTTLW